MQTDLTAAKTYTEFSGFEQLRSQAKNNTDEALPAVAKQFEALFLQMMLKSMRSADNILSENSLMRSDAVDFYQQMFDQQIAITLSDGQGIGLAKVIERQLRSSQETINKPSQGGQTALKLPATSKSDPIKTQEATMTKDIRLPSPNFAKILEHANQEKVDLFPTPIHFIKALWTDAVDAAEKLKLDPKILIAQAALETGWGKFIIKNSEGQSSNNLFNIKAGKSWSQDKIKIETKEYINGKAENIQAPFRSYESFKHSFHDYVALLTNNKRYVEALNQSENPQAFTTELQNAGYATDPDYATKIMKIYHSDELQQAIAGIASNNESR